MYIVERREPAEMGGTGETVYITEGWQAGVFDKLYVKVTMYDIPLCFLLKMYY